MTPTIWKFHVPVEDTFTLDVPSYFKPLDVQVQRGSAVLWAVVGDGDDPPSKRRFRVVGTGHPFPEYSERRWQHVGTFQIAGGALVFHLFMEEA